MVIFVSKNSKTRIQDYVEWKKEPELHDYVIENSEIIFSEFLDKGIKICAIGEELNNENGRADIIFLDQNGSLYIVETKLDSNTDRRHVLSQVTQYMSAVWSQCVHHKFEYFINDCEESIKNKFKFSGNFDEYIRQKFDIDEKTVNEIKRKLENNIRGNSIFGVIIMDYIENPLKLDIDYFLTNQFNICGIELQKYSESDTFFVVPQYYGLEKLGYVETRNTDWYKKHVEGWYVFNIAIQKNQELDENTKKSILKLTASLENIPGSAGWVRKSDDTLETYFPKIEDSDRTAFTIRVNGRLNFNLRPLMKDPKLIQDFKDQFSKIDSDIEQKIKDREMFPITVETWAPKIDEFIEFLRKFYS